MDAVLRALFEVYRLLEAELQRTAVYSLVEHYDRALERYPRATHYVRAVKDLQRKLLERSAQTPQAKMMEAVAALIDQCEALTKPEVDLMSGVTVREDFSLDRWENEGGSVQS